jgi:serine O-acetyltransferase
MVDVLEGETQRVRCGADAGLWSGIVRTACTLAELEPALRPMLFETVLPDWRPEAIVGAVLSRRLGHARGEVKAIEALIVESLCIDPTVRPALEADLVAVTQRDPACRSALDVLLNLRGFHALQTHRVAHSLWRRGRPAVAAWLAGHAAAAFGVDIHPAVPFGPGVVLDHATGVVIGETAVVEGGVLILHGVTLGATGKSRGDRHPKVRRGAMLGAGAQVLGNIEIGIMSRVGAGSVVIDPVPEHCTVAGVPARVVRERMRAVA